MAFIEREYLNANYSFYTTLGKINFPIYRMWGDPDDELTSTNVTTGDPYTRIYYISGNELAEIGYDEYVPVVRLTNNHTLGISAKHSQAVSYGLSFDDIGYVDVIRLLEIVSGTGVFYADFFVGYYIHEGIVTRKLHLNRIAKASHQDLPDDLVYGKPYYKTYNDAGTFVAYDFLLKGDLFDDFFGDNPPTPNKDPYEEWGKTEPSGGGGTPSEPTQPGTVPEPSTPTLSAIGTDFISLYANCSKPAG